MKRGKCRKKYSKYHSPHFSSDNFLFFPVGVTSGRQEELCDYDYMLILLFRDLKTIQTLKEQYFEAALGHFGVFVVKLHPLLDDTADGGVGIVDKLEAGDVGATFPQVCQVNVQEALRRDVNRDVREKMGAFAREANCHT